MAGHINVTDDVVAQLFKLKPFLCKRVLPLRFDCENQQAIDITENETFILTKVCSVNKPKNVWKMIQ